MLTKFTCQLFLVVLFALLSTPALALNTDPQPEKPEVSTSLDGNGNFQVTFDNEASLKVAGKNTACNANSEGSIRYNFDSHFLEYCNGVAWTIPASSGPRKITTYTTPGIHSYAPLPGSTTAIVELVGGGGGGSAANLTTSLTSHGGAGGYAKQVINLSTTLLPISISVGAGGAGGIGGTKSTNRSGKDGERTCFSNLFCVTGGEKGILVPPSYQTTDTACPYSGKVGVGITGIEEPLQTTARDYCGGAFRGARGVFPWSQFGYYGGGGKAATKQGNGHGQKGGDGVVIITEY